jgi:hypothetical protein
MKFAFAKALRHSRKSRGLTQVDFSDGPILVLEKEAKKARRLIRSMPSPKPWVSIS